MSDIREKLYYSKTHEWVRLETDGTAVVGVTDHAQSSMGDMVYADLPEVGKKMSAGGDCGVLESVKSASDFYSPIAGEVIAVNEKLADSPDLVNKDPYGEGWLVKIKLDNPDDVKELMDSAAYQKFLEAK